jgi:hypothetical protein
MANDIITKIDNEQVRGLTLSQAVEKMRGPVNTKIKLTIMRKGQDKPIEVTIVREKGGSFCCSAIWKIGSSVREGTIFCTTKPPTAWPTYPRGSRQPVRPGRTVAR